MAKNIQRAPNLLNWDLTRAVKYCNRFIERLNTGYFSDRVTEIKQTLYFARDPVLAYELIIAMDEELSQHKSYLDLLQFAGPNRTLVSHAYEGFHSVAKELCVLIDQLMILVEKMHRPPIDLLNWTTKIRTNQVDYHLLEAYSKLANSYLTQNSLDLYGIIIKRVDVDPQQLVFVRALKLNEIKIGVTNFSDGLAIESKKYFNSTLHRNGISKCSLSEFRDLESAQFSDFSCTLSQALKWIYRVFLRLDLKLGIAVESILKQGQLQVYEDPNTVNACIDTFWGSYIQVHFDGSLSALISLAHEFGHAIHNYHRINFPTVLDEPAISEKELWALVTENSVIELLRSTYPNLKKLFARWNQSRFIELHHRHLMLHEFELAISQSPMKSNLEIEKLWLLMNQRFYGSNIILEKDFNSAWKEIYHFAIAPFYIFTYAIAKGKAQRTNLASLIMGGDRELKNGG